jgi:hypothetical protein
MKLLKHKIALFFLWLAHTIEPDWIYQLVKKEVQSRKQDEFKQSEHKFSSEPQERVYPEIDRYDEPSGPVYRPSAEELAKMNEDPKIKEAKEAVAETIRNAPEVDL